MGKKNEILKNVLKTVTGVKQAEEAGKLVGKTYGAIKYGVGGWMKRKNMVGDYVEKKMRAEGFSGPGDEAIIDEKAKRMRLFEKKMTNKKM